MQAAEILICVQGFLKSRIEETEVEMCILFESGGKNQALMEMGRQTAYKDIQSFIQEVRELK